MDFRFSEEQDMIRDTACAFLADVSGSAEVRQAMASGADGCAAWGRIVGEMGWQALTVAEEHGGLGLGMVELAIVQEAAGARLLTAPLYATVGAGVAMLRCCASPQQQAEWLPAVAAGEETLAVAAQGPGAPWGSAGCGLRYRRDGDGYRLDGEAAYVIDGARAATLLLVATAADDPAAASARVFRVPAESAGLRRRAVSTLDQTRALAALELSAVAVGADQLLGGSAAGWSAIEPALDIATIALAAELLGVAQQTLDMAVAYTLEREQFGRPVAGFQALKHKAADMMLRSECARSALYFAACVGDAYLAGSAPAAELAEAASIAKASCGDAAFRNAGECLQMHGGVGFTWEYDVHLYFKRARAARSMLGTPDWHRERIAALVIDGQAEEEPV